MKFINCTPFSADTFDQYDLDGKMYTISSVRSTFILKLENGRAEFKISDKQDPFLWQDEYEQAPTGLLLKKQCDFVPFKPSTDVTIHGRCWFYDEKSNFMVAELEVNDRTKKIKVCGPRYWTKFENTWKLGNPELVKSVPIRWNLAFGGNYLTKTKKQDVNIYNPVGLGFIDFDNPPSDTVPAPQILNDNDVLDTKRLLKPAGFGPIAPSWETRHRYAGTYDDKWKQTRHPLLPRDFDNRFWNSAPEDQQFSPWLKGGERIKLVNMHESAYVLSFTLPHQALLCVVKYRQKKPAIFEMVLDGVHIDLERGFHPYINICWRIGIPFELGISEIKIINGVTVDDAMRNLESDDVK